MLSSTLDLIYTCRESCQQVHEKLKKRILESCEVTSEVLERYIQYSTDNDKVVMQNFVNVDLSGDVNSNKNTYEYIYTIERTTIDQMSRLQKFVVVSSTKAKYLAKAETRKKMIWMTAYLEELGKKQREKIFHTDRQIIEHDAYVQLT